jgi:hypothetical protein
MVFSKLVKDQMNAILENQHKPINTKRIEAMQLLKESHVSFELPIHTDLVLVHQENRSSLGVNAHNAHRLMGKVVTIGGDRLQLKHAVCFEIDNTDETRVFNHRLAAMSVGLLAMPSGAERFASVGCSHTTCWVRAANHGCKTNLPSVADSRGVIDIAKLKSDPEIAKMLEEGWTWTVVPSAASKEWPSLAHIIQKSLNSANTVPSDETELEIAVSIAEYASIQEKAGLSVDLNSCIDAAISGDPACAPYAATLAKITRTCGGGAGAPCLKALDAMAKMHSSNRVFGNEYLSGILAAHIDDGNGDYRPRVVLALLFTNMVAKENGGLLTGGDIRALVKRKRSECQQLEVARNVLEQLYLA